MSLDFVGEWEIRPQNGEDPRPYPPGAWLLIGRHGADACSVAWLDGDHKLCSLSAVPYDGDSRLRGSCLGRRGSGEEVLYDVEIQPLFGSDERSITGKVKSTNPPPNDDPLTGLWTADRRPPGGDPPAGEHGRAK